MPEKDYVWLPRKDILDFEGGERPRGCLRDLGVDRIRLTGGEPLVRRDLDQLVRLLAAKPAIRDLAHDDQRLPPGGEGRGVERRRASTRVTVSLDTLDRDDSRP
jgi:cyclic pyranopterin phosphate synthase